MKARLPRTREILGVDLAVTDYSGELALIAQMIDGRERGYLCHAAVNAVMNARRQPEAAAALRDSTLTLPDGMPLVWALRSLGEQISDRVYGPDLMLMACATAGPPARHFLYGGRDEAATRALVAALGERFPRIEVAGAWTPPHRPLSASERREVAALVNDSGADIVWAGTGSPAQEIWMHSMRELLEAPVLVGVGAAFDFHAGLTPQAPAWMQRRGLEWLFRMAREPRRLAPRYLRDNPAFIAAFAHQWIAERPRKGSV
jgi:N-acetylglucosaminyldiphosphoundecaprenol N-acetyl-beta-D-mannosaminyltransferase